MYRLRIMVRQTLTLGLLMTLVILALSACGGGGEGGGGEHQQQAKPRRLPEVGFHPVALHPGEYRSEEFKPSFSFRVGKGWKLDRPEISNRLAITTGGEGHPVLNFRNVWEVYNYDKTGAPAVAKVPKDMVGWFQHHPHLETEKPEPATVGEVKGVQFDYIVSEDTPSDEITLFRYTDGDTGEAGKGYKFRAIILEGVKGKTVTIGIGSPTTEFDDFLPKAQQVLDSVKWTGS